MFKSITIRRILLAPSALRTTLLPMRISQPVARQYATQSITSPSFWVNMIPKPLRKSSPSSALKKKAKSKDWNPATFYIVIFLLIGSMSIQMISLRNDFTAFSRRADAKIGLLREIIGKIQNGEDVDVEGLLGSGDAEREKEWEEVLQEIEREDEAWEQSRKSKPKHGRNLEKSAVPAPTTASISAEAEEPMPQEQPKTKAPSGFY